MCPSSNSVLSIWDNIPRAFWHKRTREEERMNEYAGTVHVGEPVPNTSLYVCKCVPALCEAASSFFCSFLPVLPKPQVSYKTTSPGVIEANCTSVSRPPAEIVWNVERDNRTMGPPVTTQLPQSDGTTLVISTLTVQSGLLKDVSVKCLVHHKGLESPIAVSMNTKSELVSVNSSQFPSYVVCDMFQVICCM